MGKLYTVMEHYLRTLYLRKRFKARQDLQAWQEERILRHLSWVRDHSPFYRELWNNRPLEEWRQFPLISKGPMMENFDRLNTVGVSKKQAFDIALEAERSRSFQPRLEGRVTVGLSSGTSGNRGLFLVSEAETWAWAGTVLAKVLPGPLWSRERVAFFLRANSNLYESVGGARLTFLFFDLMAPLEAHLEALNQYRPTLLIGPPSLLRMLAEAANSGRLKEMGTPGKIVSAAEALDPMDKDWIETVFRQPVHQIYQCTEGFLAATCSHGTLHVNEDLVHIDKEELDGSSGRFVPIVTDFTRRTQPIIRYRLDDVLVERRREAPCPCGSPYLTLERIEGRCDDLFYWPGADGGNWEEPVPVYPDFITRAIIQASLDIVEYRAIQHTPGLIELSLRVRGEADPQSLREPILRELERLCGRLGCRLPKLHISRYDWAAQEGRKLRRVERRFALGEWSTLLYEG